VKVLVALLAIGAALLGGVALIKLFLGLRAQQRQIDHLRTALDLGLCAQQRQVDHLRAAIDRSLHALFVKERR